MPFRDSKRVINAAWGVLHDCITHVVDFTLIFFLVADIYL